jgi:hypothetical protein
MEVIWMMCRGRGRTSCNSVYQAKHKDEKDMRDCVSVSNGLTCDALSVLLIRGIDAE